jgi:hypothetical protein
VADFFGQGGEVVLDLADVVRLATETGDAGTHGDLAEFDEFRFETAAVEDLLNQAVGVAVFDGAS